MYNVDGFIDVIFIYWKKEGKQMIKSHYMCFCCLLDAWTVYCVSSRG